jgi:ribonuclease HI
MYFDGSKRIQGAGAGVVLISPQGDKLKYVLRMSFPQASNNEAEYEALLHGMKMAKACGATRLKIFRDSNLVVQQVMNKCDAISDNMTTYINLYYYLEGTFDGCEVLHVSRASNEEADNLANIGSQCLPVPQVVLWEEIIERSIKNSKVSTTGEQVQHQAAGSRADNSGTAEPKEVTMIEETWMQPYLAYMVNKTLPEDTVQAKRIIRRSKAFVVLQGKLYKKSITGVLQWCVTPQEGQEILKDIHTGVCGHHASSRAIAAKAFRVGFYSLTAIEDAKDIVRKCEACQRFASRPHAPAAELQPIPLSWPFAQWGLDMVGKLHKSWPGGHVYMLVAVDKFTKWVEAAPVTTQDSIAVINFIKSIVFRFGVPHSIITDNGTNFTSKEFKNYCENLGIKLKFAFVAHPKTNGQVEKANGLICNGIKKRLLAPLEKAKHAWVDELPSVLWSLQTTPNAATQETPFFLVHGAEAILLVEITHEAPRIAAYDETTSTEALQDNVDALDEALARATQYQQNLRNYHSTRVRPRSFVVGDLVLRLKQDGHGKLESPWVGPYIVTEVIPGGAYRLQDKKTGKYESNPWNAEQL